MREGGRGREGGTEGGRGEGEREISCAKILGHKILGSGLIRVSAYKYDQLSNGHSSVTKSFLSGNLTLHNTESFTYVTLDHTSPCSRVDYDCANVYSHFLYLVMQKNYSLTIKPFYSFQVFTSLEQ